MKKITAWVVLWGQASPLPPRLALASKVSPLVTPAAVGEEAESTLAAICRSHDLRFAAVLPTINRCRIGHVWPGSRGGLRGTTRSQKRNDLLQKYFSKIPAGASVPAVDLTESRRRHEVRFTFSDSFAPFPALLISQLIPERKHPAFYPLELLEKILFDGESSRLYRKLVEEEQLALHVVGGQDGKFGPALYLLFAQFHPQKKLTDLEKAIYSEFEQIQNRGVSEEELEKARNKVKADFISQQESVRSLADTLCMYHTIYQQPERFFTELDRFEKVTAAEIQRVAKEFLAPAGRSVIEVFPGKRTDEELKTESSS